MIKPVDGINIKKNKNTWYMFALILLILVAVQTVLFSFEGRLVDSYSKTSITKSNFLSDSLEAIDIVVKDPVVSDDCSYCYCCHIFLNVDSSCNILQTIDYFPACAFVSSELKGYMSVPFRPPKYT